MMKSDNQPDSFKDSVKAYIAAIGALLFTLAVFTRQFQAFALVGGAVLVVSGMVYVVRNWAKFTNR